MNGRKPSLPRVHAADRAEWRAWLEKNHVDHSSIELVFYKKGTGKSCITYDEAVEEALCFGWIDSLKSSLDTERYTFMFSSRRAGSNWSKSNKARVEKLIGSGRMTPAGLAKIEAAKRDGSWTALDGFENPVPPASLIEALARNARARKHFEQLRPAPRKLLLRWITSAKRAETRQERIAATVAAAARGRMPEAFDRLMPARRSD